jgi:hypothetical protein
MTTAVRNILAACAAACVIAGCGGGGDGGGGGAQGPVVSTLDFPIAGSKSASAQSTSQFSLAGTLDGTNYIMSVGVTPGPASTFEGKAASTSTITLTFRANGALVSQEILTSYFAQNPYVDYGTVNQGNGQYTVSNQIANFPATAKVGQLGSLGTEVTYTNSLKAQVVNTSTLTWSLDADTATTALSCVNVQIVGSTAGTVSGCDRIDRTGTILGRIMKLTVNGKTLTLN